MVIKLITMQTMLPRLIHHVLLTTLFILRSLSVVFLQMVSNVLQLMVIILRKLSLKPNFGTTKKLKKDGRDARSVLKKRTQRFY